MTAEQAENNFQSYLAHIRFREDRDRWPHHSEEKLRERYGQLCQAEAILKEKYRQRRPPGDEVKQGLPTLIAADIKKRQVSPPVKSVPRQPQLTARRGHEPLDIKA